MMLTGIWDFIERKQALSSSSRLIGQNRPWYSTSVDCRPYDSNFPKYSTNYQLYWPHQWISEDVITCNCLKTLRLEHIHLPFSCPLYPDVLESIPSLSIHFDLISLTSVSEYSENTPEQVLASLFQPINYATQKAIL